MLVGVAIVFPVVFSIGSAYNRRESALQRFSDFKGHAIAIFYATRDWTTDKEHKLPQEVRSLVTEMMAIMRVMFTSNNRTELQENERRIYAHFSKLSGITNAATRRSNERNFACEPIREQNDHRF
jgi:hypothetical protein